MGRMKEVCIQIIDANNGIPEGMTIEDVVRMKELEIYNWREYEREKDRRKIKFNESENSGETRKVEKIQKKFSSVNGKTRKEKRNKQ
jgi:hypothetical protein